MITLGLHLVAAGCYLSGLPYAGMTFTMSAVTITLLDWIDDGLDDEEWELDGE